MSLAPLFRAEIESPFTPVYSWILSAQLLLRLHPFLYELLHFLIPLPSLRKLSVFLTDDTPITQLPVSLKSLAVAVL